MIIITGGAGFIGSNIIASLEEANPNVECVVVDRLRDGVKWQNIAKRNLLDIVHPDNLAPYLNANADKVRAIIHMGAISATTERDADKIVHNNLDLSTLLWHWCAQHNVAFIYASSAATYGDGSHGFIDDFTPEHLAKLRPLNAYGWSKHQFDRRVLRWTHQNAPKPPQWVGLKFFNVYGPNEIHKTKQSSVIQQVYPFAKQDKPFQLFRSHHPDYPDGGQMRDFVYVKDVCAIITWLLDNPQVSGLYNVGTAKSRTFYDLAATVYRALGKEPSITYRDTPEEIRDKYQYYTEARMDKLRAQGYDAPMTSLEDGITEYVQQYLDADDPYR